MNNSCASGNVSVASGRSKSAVFTERGLRPWCIPLAQLFVILVFLCACGAKPEAKPVDPYRPDVLAAYKIATSDFERQVLKDGLITRQEYEEAVNRFLDCMKKSGYPMGKVDNYGIYNYQISGNSGAEGPSMDKCHQDTIIKIEPLYVDKHMNPLKQDLHELIAKCLIRKKIAPPDYSKEKYLADVKKNMKGSVVDDTDPKFAECSFTPTAP